MLAHTCGLLFACVATTSCSTELSPSFRWVIKRDVKRWKTKILLLRDGAMNVFDENDDITRISVFTKFPRGWKFRSSCSSKVAK
jgi:hypothetical protein